MSITQMLAVPANPKDEARERAAFDAAAHIRRNGLALHDLVELADDAEALEAVEILIGEMSAGFPDPDVMARALGTVSSCLADMSFELLDHLSQAGRGPRDLAGAVAWHGARVSDLLGSLRPV